MFIVDTTPTYPKRFASYEEFLAYRRIVNARYAKTEKGRASLARKNAGPVAQARYARYRETEKYRATQRRYKETAKGKATALAALQTKRTTHPEMKAAHQAVQVAVRNGLPRPAACSCGSAGRLQAHHHNGYAPEHWLDVVWLCPKCHKAAHR